MLTDGLRDLGIYLYYAYLKRSFLSF